VAIYNKINKNMKLLSPSDAYYYKPSIIAIMDVLKTGKPEYTFMLAGLNSTFRNKNDQPKLRQVLRTLEHHGFIKNINLGHNIHQWQITDKQFDFSQLTK